MFDMGMICDLSYHQGNIDFARLSKVVDMVILRVQCGSTFVDPKYTEYVVNCKKYGIPFGTYAYAKFINVSDALQEAKDAYARMDKDSKFMVLDCEEMTLRNPNDIVPAAQAFIDYMKQQGLKVGLYSGQYFYNNYRLSNLKYDFLWLAKYSNNEPSIGYDLWQYTSSGLLPGINGNVDLNKVGSKPISYFTGGGNAFKVIIPNVAFWQAKALVAEYESRGFKCQGVSLKVYQPNQQPAENDPYWFVIDTDYENAKQLVIELKIKGYDRTYGEKKN
jgi:GH25 family lysozyme M1 (1,4-beta-N-acetylmuramidase)